MFLERPWYLTAVSLFTNQLFLLILYRCLSKNFFTLGLLSKKEKKKPDVFDNLAFLPHAYVFILNMVIVLLFANAEINSRVASTCPFYYYAWAQLIIEVLDDLTFKEKIQKVKEMASRNALNNLNTFGTEVEKKISTYKHMVVGLSLFYNSVVLFLNPLLFTVEVGFI
jgi:hypothetical protein